VCSVCGGGSFFQGMESVINDRNVVAGYLTKITYLIKSYDSGNQIRHALG
jgi:hypothetical protein